jgi:hypothetical protein
MRGVRGKEIACGVNGEAKTQPRQRTKVRDLKARKDLKRAQVLRLPKVLSDTRRLGKISF